MDNKKQVVIANKNLTFCEIMNKIDNVIHSDVLITRK